MATSLKGKNLERIISHIVWNIRWATLSVTSTIFILHLRLHQSAAFFLEQRTLVKMWISTDSSDPSLVTYALYFVYVGSEDPCETVDMYRLIRTFSRHLRSVFCVCEQGRVRRDCVYAQTHFNHLLRVSPMLHICVCEQGARLFVLCCLIRALSDYLCLKLVQTLMKCHILHCLPKYLFAGILASRL